MIVLSGAQTINAFLKKEKKTSLASLRKKRANYVDRWKEAIEGGALTQKHVDNASFQKISRSDIREEIIEALPDSDFFWIGHYAARDSQVLDDAYYFKYLLSLREG